MIFQISFKLLVARGYLFCQFRLNKRYRVLCRASVDALWQKLINLADVSWNPLLARTNVPNGLMAKPGLIYQVVTRFTPIPIRIFVEQVDPRKLLSVRFLAIPGVENRVTYQFESSVCGTYISYSVTLRGLLSPVLWWVIRPYVARVADNLAQAVERPAPL
ncbi:polyketide cyclase/dehydrase and lipid transport protein [Spirulina major]|uniref:polyketide cyclase/dehydrase and lipid transport protein n=1 Tax=Spirulina major TaxID=270636 RepID=UPI000934C299|nr:polyketide cyclase/dehydrase and lipid transport protein [Spirulina major]